MSNLAQVIRELDVVVSRIISLIGVRVTRNIVESTPVDTGHAKANWVPRVGSPFTGIAGSRESTNRGPQSTGLGLIGRYRLGSGPIFIANNVDYIGDLNNGSSAQAPAAFVQGGIIRGIVEAKALASTITVKGGR